MLNLDPVTKFMARVKAMQTGRSKEMRLTYEEAHALSLTIAQLLCEEVKKIEPNDGVIILSGGSLKPTQGK